MESKRDEDTSRRRIGPVGQQLARRFPKKSRKAASAAWKPHMPWTPPPGGVEAEHK